MREILILAIIVGNFRVFWLLSVRRVLPDKVLKVKYLRQSVTSLLIFEDEGLGDLAPALRVRLRASKQDTGANTIRKSHWYLLCSKVPQHCMRLKLK